MRFTRIVSFTLAIALVSGVRYQAQVAASLSGSVEDSSGAGIPNANVSARNVETGVSRTVSTDSDGSFRLPSLPVGPLEMKVEKAGFASEFRTGISLAVGQEAVVRFRLAVGNLAQETTVSEPAPLVNATTASISGLVGEREVKDLPLNGRSFDALITLNPGAINYSAMKSANTSTSNGNTFSVAGRRTGENLFLLNGVEYTGSSQLGITPGGVSGDLLGIDAVREFNVMTDTYSAQYGKRAGAQINVVTQSGTNQLRGSLFEFLRNSVLDARNPLSNSSTKPPFRQNQFGAALGGPLVKDRLFAFANFEGYRQELNLNSISVVPDAQARTGMLPNSTTGVYTPVANLNAKILPYMVMWPTANGPELMTANSVGQLIPSGTALSFNTPRQSISEDFGTIRSDYTLRAKDVLSGSYTLDSGHSLIPLADPFFGSYTTLGMQVASLQETHFISPAALNTVRVGYSRAAFNLSSSLLASFPSTLAFVNGRGPGGIVIGGGVTTTASGTITSAGPNNAAGAWNRRNLYTLSDDFQFQHGAHQLSAGVWFQPVQDNEDSASRQLGQASFASLTTFLQGALTTYQVIPSATELGWRSLFGAWYVEDNVKLRSNLTMRVGLRHEFTTGWNEEFGRASNYLTDASGTLQTSPVVGNSVFSKNNATKLFSPRAAIAWDPFGGGKTALRAGAGLYYSLIDDLAFLLNSLPPYNAALSYTGSLPSVLASPPPACAPGVPTPCATYAPQGIQPDAKTPAAAEWNLSVERELEPNIVVRVAYVGSHGYHGFLSVDPNSISSQICAPTGTASGCTAGGTGATTSVVPAGTQYVPVAGRPNPLLSGGFFWYTEGNSSYNAFQADLLHRLTRGLQFRANYTWSKNLDMNSGLTGAQSSNQAQMILDHNHPARDWGRSALNAPQQLSLSGRYELPFGKDKRWLPSEHGVAGYLTSGWQLNGIGTFLSGFPFTPLVGSNRSGDGDTRNPDRPNPNPAFTGDVVTHNPNQWFNPAAFLLPAAGTYGSLGRSTLTGPRLSDVDVSLFKDSRVSEGVKLQIRAEFFNVLNHTNFGTPNTTVFSNGQASASAGLITTTATPQRQIQFGLKLIF